MYVKQGISNTTAVPFEKCDKHPLEMIYMGK